MAVGHSMVVAMPVVSSLDFRLLGAEGMTPQVAAYQQILNLLPAISGPQLLSLRQVLHDAHGQVRNAGKFWWQCQPTLHGCSVKVGLVGVDLLDDGIREC